ncbi:methionine-R-sulfoxide reductase B1-A [Caerostris extrusa]|uniref:peptide-methionine (R)-S-oxide reductase n=1 Tax=Caerostris extrusa TaxID=172846 RepID=A0AAV4NR61_CAEEX|nr:methionine-R-sulfoxide reductase B1-A [Caerostris extrusa]
MSFCTWNSDEKYRDTFKSGIYNCVKCGNELFSSRTKFEHFSPWPSFTETVHENSVTKREETFRPSLTYKVKCFCGKCGYGLGHEFVGDGPGGKSRF